MFRSRIVSCLTVAVVLTGCSSFSGDKSDSNGNSSSGLTTISVGVAPTAETTPAYLAQSLGYFKDEHLDVTLVTIPNGQAAVPALLNGQLQISASGNIQPFTASLQNIKLALIGDTGQNAFHLMVQGDSPIRSVADLKGKSVGIVAFKSSPEVSLFEALQSAGLSPDSIKEVAIPSAQQQSALLAGRVDAIAVTEPFYTEDLQAGLRALPGESSAVAGYFVTTASYAATHPQVAQGFIRSYDKARKYATTNPDAARKATGTYTQIAPNVLSKISLVDWRTDNFALSTINAFVAKLVQFGELSDTPDVAKMYVPKS